MAGFWEFGGRERGRRLKWVATLQSGACACGCADVGAHVCGVVDGDDGSFVSLYNSFTHP